MSILFIDYGLFLLKILTVVGAVGLLVAIVVGTVSRARRGDGSGDSSEGKLQVVKYNERLEALEEALSMSRLEPAERKEAAKARKVREKEERKQAKVAAKRARKQRGAGETLVPETVRPRSFVMDFDGDIRASAVEQLRREITAVLTSATPEDEVVLRLDSGGGMVTSYGLAASQLDRIRKKHIPLVVCVDKVAASGGYMMACVADRIVAAPFAVLGSIGVVAQLPNFSRLLKKWDIDVELLTAGKYKRTLTVFGENTDEGREKFIEDIERIHGHFKRYVDERRPKLDIERVATGEIWSGDDALALELADELGTSDDYLLRAAEAREVLLVRWKEKKGLASRFSFGVEAALERVAVRLIDRLARLPLD